MRRFKSPTSSHIWNLRTIRLLVFRSYQTVVTRLLRIFVTKFKRTIKTILDIKSEVYYVLTTNFFLKKNGSKFSFESKAIHSLSYFIAGSLCCHAVLFLQRRGGYPIIHTTLVKVYKRLHYLPHDNSRWNVLYIHNHNEISLELDFAIWKNWNKEM